MKPSRRYGIALYLVGLLIGGWGGSHHWLSAAHGAYVGPIALVAARDGRTLYVACHDARQVAWVDVASSRVTQRVAVPGVPTGLVMTADGTQLLVTCAAPRSTIVALDAVTGQVRASIPAGHTAMGPALSPDGTRLYVCNRFDNDVSVIDVAAGQALCRVPAVREPVAAAVTPDGRTVLVANHLANTRTHVPYATDVSPVVTVIDAATYATAAIELPGGSNGVRGVSILPDGARAVVTHLLGNFQMVPFRVDMGWINTNVVSLLDVPQRKLVSTIGLDDFDRGAGNPWDVVGTSDGKTVVVSLAGTHELSVIDRTALLSEQAHRTMSPMMGAWPIYPSLGASLWRRIKLPGQGPRGLAIAGGKVYVAEYFSDTVSVVDLEAAADAAPRTIALGPKPALTVQRRGELLFHDATICYQQWQSCASCHPDGRTDALTWDLMNDGVGNPKSTKSMLLAHPTPPAMAEGVRMTAEEAVRSGLTNILFVQRPEEEAAAIDAYLQSLQPVPSPHLVDGRLRPAAARGQVLFHSDRVACHRCHPAPLYTDLKRHNVGTRSPNEHGERFDTPTLIEAWRTAPYLHDGRYLTIQELLGEGRHGLRRDEADGLTAQELNDLVAFVLSL